MIRKIKPKKNHVMSALQHYKSMNASTQLTFLNDLPLNEQAKYVFSNFDKEQGLSLFKNSILASPCRDEKEKLDIAYTATEIIHKTYGCDQSFVDWLLQVYLGPKLGEVFSIAWFAKHFKKPKDVIAENEENDTPPVEYPESETDDDYVDDYVDTCPSKYDRGKGTEALSDDDESESDASPGEFHSPDDPWSR